jgi:hypothetical protein
MMAFGVESGWHFAGCWLRVTFLVVGALVIGHTLGQYGKEFNENTI